MSWCAYKLVFSLNSPLHIGKFKIGNIQRTRYYVPGITFCGALTATITRMNNSKDYSDVETKLNDFFAFSYLYLTVHPEGKEPLYPCFTENKFQFGKEKITAEEFEFNYISSYASTALNYSLQIAAEGSLHDVEYICPKKTSCGKQVYLTGNILVNEEALPSKLQDWRRDITANIPIEKLTFSKLASSRKSEPLKENIFLVNDRDAPNRQFYLPKGMRIYTKKLKKGKKKTLNQKALSCN